MCSQVTDVFSSITYLTHMTACHMSMFSVQFFLNINISNVNQYVGIETETMNHENQFNYVAKEEWSEDRWFDSPGVTL